MAVQYGGVSQETLRVAPLDYTAGEVARGGSQKKPERVAPSTWPYCYRQRVTHNVITRAMRFPFWLGAVTQVHPFHGVLRHHLPQTRAPEALT